MLYEPKFETEVRELIRVVKSKVNEKAYVHDLANTKALSRFYLFFILELAEGVIGAIRNRSLAAYNVAIRSLLEYSIDLKYIILKNDTETNSLFANYRKLRNYWLIDHIEIDKVRRQVERDFKSYVESRFSDELEKCAKKVIGTNKNKWTEVSKVLKKTYDTHWSGLGFEKRVKFFEAVYKERTREENKFPFDRIMLYYKMYCQYTHPTPYSVAPHYCALDGAFFPLREYSDNSLEEAERFLSLIVAYSSQFFAEVLDAPFNRQLNTLVEREIDHSKALGDRYGIGKTINATRTSNK